jgi:hypothetical protein
MPVYGRAYTKSKNKSLIEKYPNDFSDERKRGGIPQTSNRSAKDNKESNWSEHRKTRKDDPRGLDAKEIDSLRRRRRGSA